jgi:periplasmic divalent cation tolerance protein
MSPAVVVLTTIPADLDAEAFVRALLADRLAACVSVLPPMVSTYWWQGHVESATERQVVLKTTRERLDGLERRLVELHPYDVPELLVLPVSGGSARYLEWIGAETTGDRGRDS